MVQHVFQQRSRNIRSSLLATLHTYDTTRCHTPFQNMPHPTLLSEQVLKRQDHDPFVPLLAVPNHSVRFPCSGASVRENGRVKAVQHALQKAKKVGTATETVEGKGT